MPVRLRLQRFGRHNRPFYRIVAADSRSPRDGKFIEIVGTYDPIAGKDGIKEVRLKAERIRYWISVGAQPSDRVSWLLSMYHILPPAPLRPTTVKHLPKKQRKEMAEAAAKKFHTFAFGSLPLPSLSMPLLSPGLGSMPVCPPWAREALARLNR